MSEVGIADKTPVKQRGTPWKKGQSGNPKGRPKGSRGKLAENFLSDLHEAWEAKKVSRPLRLLRHRSRRHLSKWSVMFCREKSYSKALRLPSTAPLRKSSEPKVLSGLIITSWKHIGSEKPLLEHDDYSNEAEQAWALEPDPND